MRKVILFALALSSFIPSSFLLAQSSKTISESQPILNADSTSLFNPILNSKNKFEAFTGKVAKSKVRLRLQPNYEATVIKEIEPGELFVVMNENDDFVAVKPPSEFKAYVFRTFVLDNVIEGNRVNVRLKPDLDAPVVAQLNSGDKIEGVVDPANPKWLKIEIPESTYFYIGKEYVEKIGDANYLARQEKRRQDVENLLSFNTSRTQQEMEKPFNQINIENIKNSYQHIITDYTDFPEAVKQANQDLAALQESYIHKKLIYLEEQSRLASTKAEDAHRLSKELKEHKTKIADLEQQLDQNRFFSEPLFNSTKPQTLPLNMSAWMPAEEGLFAAWSRETGYSDKDYFYQEQSQHAINLRGVIEPYTRPFKNKPGDYLLVNPVSRLPTAYLYSTQINLQDYVGHEITIKASPRPNNHFAYPAYYVLYVE